MQIWTGTPVYGFYARGFVRCLLVEVKRRFSNRFLVITDFSLCVWL